MGEVELTCENVVTYISSSLEILKKISDLLSFEQPGVEHIQRNLPYSAWDGKTRLLKGIGKKSTSANFPAGLTNVVYVWCIKNNITCRIKDARSVIPIIKSHKFIKPINLRSYQKDAVEMACKQSRGIIVMGTGGGKTLTSAYLVGKMGLNTLFITPDVGLRKQTFTVYQKFFGGLVSDTVHSLTPIVIANIQSLVNKKDSLFKRFNLLITDEFHHSAAKTYLKLNHLVENAYWRYGLTGTNIRTDGKDMLMHGILSSVLYTKTTSELIDDGWLVPPFITIIRYQVKGWSRLNYREAYSKITTDNDFNTIVAGIAYEKAIIQKKRTLILVRRKDHGALLENLMEDQATYLTGDDNFERREEVKKDFNSGRIRCLIATEIFGEGQDIPNIDCLINARFNESEIQTKQGIGRALRLAEGAKDYEDSVKRGKSMAEIYDFLIIGQRNLTDHSVSRIKQYKSEPKFKIKVVRV